MENKSKVINLFHWLFGEEITLREEQDITLAPYYEDSNIYYTEEIYQLFQTSAMQRQGKVLHLAAKMFRESNTYHTRLEHSKGAYRRCIEFLMMQYEKEEWRKYIEENRLKGYLVEKIKFMCVHDIGHFMLSHSTERIVGDKNCTHEKIGQRIIQEDPEVKEVIPSVQLEEDKREEILKKIEEMVPNVSKGIYSYEGKFKKYNKEEPVYVEGEGEKIYTLDQHPQLQMDLADEYRYGVYAVIPELKEQGIEYEKIQAIKAIIEEYQKEEIQEEKKTAPNRMSLFRTQHTKVNYAKKMDEFFGEDGR